jgi:cytidine deaminase
MIGVAGGKYLAVHRGEHNAKVIRLLRGLDNILKSATYATRRYGLVRSCEGGPGRMAVSTEQLAEAALEARKSAHSPYSKFRVGAALLDAEDRIHTGCNIENATYGLTICAERVAIFKAMSMGIRKFQRIAVATDAAEFTPPCGACRQILFEFCGDIEVVLVAGDGRTKVTSVGELFPSPFDDKYFR